MKPVTPSPILPDDLTAYQYFTERDRDGGCEYFKRCRDCAAPRCKDELGKGASLAVAFRRELVLTLTRRGATMLFLTRLFGATNKQIYEDISIMEGWKNRDNRKQTS